MFKKLKNPDIVEIPQTGETLKTTLISDPTNPSPMDNYIIIRPKTVSKRSFENNFKKVIFKKAGKTPKLLLMKADFHQVRPIRDLVEDKGEYEGEELRGKAYSEKKIAIGEAFGSSKQQRALKKNSTKEMFEKHSKIFRFSL